MDTGQGGFWLYGEGDTRVALRLEWTPGGLLHVEVYEDDESAALLLTYHQAHELAFYVKKGPE